MRIPPEVVTSESAGGVQEEVREKDLQKEDQQDDENGGEVDSARFLRGQDLPERPEDRLGRAVEKLHDRIARIGVHPGDHGGDDHEPLHDRQDREEDLEHRSQKRASDVHAAFLGPKSAVPTRTSVAPSSTATSKSWLIPIESSGIARPETS